MNHIPDPGYYEGRRRAVKRSVNSANFTVRYSTRTGKDPGWILRAVVNRCHWVDAETSRSRWTSYLTVTVLHVKQSGDMTSYHKCSLMKNVALSLSDHLG